MKVLPNPLAAELRRLDARVAATPQLRAPAAGATVTTTAATGVPSPNPTTLAGLTPGQSATLAGLATNAPNVQLLLDAVGVLNLAGSAERVPAAAGDAGDTARSSDAGRSGAAGAPNRSAAASPQKDGAVDPHGPAVTEPQVERPMSEVRASATEPRTPTNGDRPQTPPQTLTDTGPPLQLLTLPYVATRTALGASSALTPRSRASSDSVERAPANEAVLAVRARAMRVRVYAALAVAMSIAAALMLVRAL